MDERDVHSTTSRVLLRNDTTNVSKCFNTTAASPRRDANDCFGTTHNRKKHRCKKDDTTPVGTTPVIIPPQATVQATVNLRSTSGFAILAGSLLSNVSTSAITGDFGLSPAARSFITGFGLTEVTGTIYAADDVSPAGVAVMLTAAKGDLTTAYNDAAGRVSTDRVLLDGNLGGLTLTPGIYKSSGSLELSWAISPSMLMGMQMLFSSFR